MMILYSTFVYCLLFTQPKAFASRLPVDDCFLKRIVLFFYILPLYINQINVRTLIGQSAVGYCAGKPTEKLRVF